MEKIKRYAQVEFRAKEDEERTIEGFASVFNQETDLGWFYEKIDRHAFDNCDMSDVYLLMNHDPNLILAGTQNNSLELSVKDNGLFQKSKIVETSQGNDYLQLVKEGLIRKMSFGFTIDRNEGEIWTIDEEGKEHRTITKIDRLFDVSIVTYPAYDGTSVRSIDELDDLAKAHFEVRQMEENKEVVEETIEETTEQVEEPIVETTEVVEETTEKVEEVTNEESTKIEEKEERKMNKNFEQVSMPENKVEDIKAWRNYVMAGKEERAGIKSTDAGVPVPTIFQSYVETAWEKVDILNEVSKSFIKGIFKVPHEVSATGAAYHVEGAEPIAEQELTLGATSLIPMMIKKWVSVTDELMAMTDDEFMQYVADEVVYHILKLLKDNILVGVGQGSGANEGVVGIANAALTEKINATLDFNLGNIALAEVDGGESPLMVMNRKTFFKNVLGLTDTQGRPIYSIVADNAGKPQYFVNGIRVKFSNALPAYDDATSGNAWAIVGDFKAYKLNLPNGEEVETLFDPYTLATADKARMIGKIFVAGNVVRGKALAALTIA